MNRRSFLGMGASGLAALWLAEERAAAAGAVTTPRPRAEACIVLWLNGGPSHVDTFDPKPGTRFGGPFRAVATRAPGVRFSEHLPRLAEQAHRLAVLRGLTSREGNHQRARFLGHTGYSPNPTASHPAIGAWVSARRGDPGADLPAFVSIGGPSAGGGFLGVQHSPFIVPSASAPPANVRLPRGVDAPRFDARREALGFLEQRFASETGDTRIGERRAVYDTSARLMRSPRLGAFDLTSEPEQTRKAYGDSDFGRGCLMARRLVEAGVRYVEVELDGWDTHKDNFERTKRLMATLDPAASALLADLAARDRLDRTLVVIMGEFGRTPVINGDDGRDHHPSAMSALLAGGGVRGGTVHGRTDESGDQVVDGKTTLPDLSATMATLLGLDPKETVYAPARRPISMTDGGRVIAPILL